MNGVLSKNPGLAGVWLHAESHPWRMAHSPKGLDQKQGEDEGEQGERFDDGDRYQGLAVDGGLFGRGLDRSHAAFALIDG